MPYQKPSQNSTITFSWTTVPVESEQLSYFRSAGKLEPPPAQDNPRPVCQDPPLGVVWERTDGRPEGKYKPWVTVPAASGSHYDAYAAYTQAQRRQRPDVSPHHALRKVGAAKTPEGVESLRTTGVGVYRVLKFLKEYGPLSITDPDDTLQESPISSTLLDGDYSGREWVDLDFFWERQKTFATAYSLWDGRNDADVLRKTLLDLLVELPEHPDLEEIWQYHGRMFAAELGRPPTAKRLTHAPDRDLPPKEKWVRTAPYEQLALFADAIVAHQINTITDIKHVWISWFDRQKRRLSFQPTLQPASLWAACWQFFASDTLTGKLARICPHCARLFYPKRKEQIFCTSQLQQLFAKRRWASGKRSQTRQGEEI
jgi:hypothetical protein